MARSRRLVVRRRAAPGPGVGGMPRPEVPGYRLGSPLGFGLGGPVWSATAGDGSPLPAGAECVVAVATGKGERRAEQQRRRVAALVGARHEHLADVLEVVRLRGGHAVVSRRVEGPTLAALRLARPPLTVPEVTSLLAPLAGALAHLHRHGVAHGDVSPANIVLTAAGRPVLVDLLGERTTERGTPGFAAPERVAGEPGPAADVWSLAAVALWLLAPRDREQVAGILAPALAPEPHARCSAAALALLAERLGEPCPIAIPAPASLAHGTLRARGALAETRPGRRRGGLRGTAGRHRAPRPGRRLAPVAVAAVLVVASAALGAASVAPGGASAERSAPPAGRPDASARAEPAALTAGTDPPRGEEESPGLDPASVERLIRDRDRALAVGDGAALLALAAPGSRAQRSDARLATALARGYRAEGLRTTVHRVSVLAERAGATEVEVVTAQSAYLRVAPDGTVTEVAERRGECAVLVVSAGPSPLLQDVRGCSAARTGNEAGPSPQAR